MHRRLRVAQHPQVSIPFIDRTAADAEAAAERIVADVAALAIPHAGSRTGGTVTISVGAATHNPTAAASYRCMHPA